MSQDLWYYSPGGEEKFGPTPGDDIRRWVGAGQLTGEDLVWRPGMDDWMPIKNVLELQPARPEPVAQNRGAEAQSPDIKVFNAGMEWLKESLKPKSWLNTAKLKILAIFVVAPWTLFKIVIVPSMVSRGASTLAERYGVEMSIEDWDANLLDLSATAKNVVILAPGPYAENKLLSAKAIEVDLSLLSGLLDGRWVQGIQVQEPKLYLERLLAGHWNWQDLISAPISPPVSAVTQVKESESEQEGFSFLLSGLSIEGMGLQWVENLPGGSKGGMIQEVKTTLFVDDMSVSAKNLVGLVDLSTQPNSVVNLEARTGSGKISFSGRANFFSWAVSEDRSDSLTWMPALEGRIYLENVGCNALARLVPDAAIVPEGGTMTGNIELKVAEQKVECQANLNIRNAFFTANQASRFVSNNASSINAQLSSYRADGQYQFSCGGRLGEGAYRPFQAFQTNVIRQGVSRAPQTVQALAAVEHVRYSEDPIDPSLENEANRILRNTDSDWLEWVGLAVTVDNKVRGLRDRLKRGF